MAVAIVTSFLIVVFWLISNNSITLSGQIDVWFGIAPFCPIRNQAICQLYDLKFITDDTVGAGYECLKGKKVLCRTKQLKISLINIGNSTFKVVTYSVMGTTFASGRNGQVERTCRIPRALLHEVPDVDVIVITALFTHGCLDVVEANRRLTISNLLELYGFPYTFSIGEDTRTEFYEKGGIFIASKWPLFGTRVLNFRNNGGLGPFVQRGAIYALVVKSTMPEVVYHLVATQLQGGDDRSEVRVDQAREIFEFIKELDIPSTEALVIAGNFNCDRQSSPMQCAEVMTRMGVIVPGINGTLKATVDPLKNKMVGKEQRSAEWLDYVVYSKHHKLPERSEMVAIDMKSNNEFSYCSYFRSTTAVSRPYQVSALDDICEKTTQISDLSDHFPVLAKFEYT